jgi:hypothetical protein
MINRRPGHVGWRRPGRRLSEEITVPASDQQSPRTRHKDRPDAPHTPIRINRFAGNDTH